MKASNRQALSERCQPGDSRPLVSVICATYNQKPYIQTCLDAILAQVTNFDVEIIIHDDASTDGTADTIRAYAERHPDKIRAIIQPKRVFSPTKRIRLDLYQYVRGQYIAFCDGDDFWRDPDKLRKQVRYLELNPHFVLCYHDANIVDGNGKTIYSHARAPEANQNFSQAALRTLACGWIPLPAMMHRHVDLGYPPEFDLSPNSDNFLLVLLGKHGGAGHLREIKYSAVRFHGSNYFSTMSIAEKNRMHLQTHLQTVSYLLRTGDIENAKLMLTNRLTQTANSFLRP